MIMNNDSTPLNWHCLILAGLHLRKRFKMWFEVDVEILKYNRASNIRMS